MSTSNYCHRCGGYFTWKLEWRSFCWLGVGGIPHNFDQCWGGPCDDDMCAECLGCGRRIWSDDPLYDEIDNGERTAL